MTSNLTISVVIPTYNRAPLLPRAIDSALGQLRAGDEVVVVDDGSTDETPAVLDRYEGRVRVVRGPRRGAGAARNRGIEAATGDLIAFLDSDDEWFPDKTRLQRGLFEARPGILFAFGDMACTFRDGSVARNHLWTWHRDPRPWEEILPGRAYSELAPLPEACEDVRVHVGDLFHDFSRRLYILTSSFIVRREAGAAIRYEEDVPIYEDWACFGRVARLGDGAFFDTELAWQHGQAPDRVSDAGDYERCGAHLELLRTIWRADPAYVERHGAELLELEETLLRRLAKHQIGRGQGFEARSTLDRMTSPPASLGILARLPPVMVRSLLGVRRLVRERLV